MNFPSNKITDIHKYYLEKLAQSYAKDEPALLLDMIFERLVNLTRSHRALNPDLRLTESEMLKVHFAVKQLLKQIPIQYVLNHCFFYGLSFFVDERVLIPRPETEELVDWIVKNSGLKKGRPFILDIGTGSGCIAVALKHTLPLSNVWAMDVSYVALEVARRNALDNKVDISFFEDDVLSPLLSDQLPDFDVIVSNPPYVRESEKEQMKPNVLDYEPATALFVSDENPLVFYKSIIQYSMRKLKHNGILYFEINRDFGQQISNLLQLAGFTEINVLRDMSGNNRMISARRGSD